MRVRSLGVVLIVLLVAAGSWGRTSLASHADAPRASALPYLVVIVIDGMRADYTTLAPMQHLRALARRGMSYDTAWVGQVEAETPASHATIATGAYPRTTGVIGFGWRDRQTGLFTFMPTDLGQIEAGALTKTIEGGGVPTMADLIHQRKKSDLVLSISGEKLWASAPLGVGADYVLYGKETPDQHKQVRFRPQVVPPNMPPPRTGYQSVTEPDSTFDTQDDFAARLAVKLVDTLRPRALLLNLPATDIAGHYYGGMGDPNDMRSIIKGADGAIGLVVNAYRRLGLLDRTVFVVTGDHGMVTGYHRIVGHPIKEAILHSPGNLYVLQLHNSIGSVWLRDPAQAQATAANLAAGHFPGLDGALYKVPDGKGGWTFAADPSTAKSLPPAVLKAYLHLADTEASPMGADVLLPYREDTTGLPVTHQFHGMHGGFSWGSQHIPLIVAGPGVRHGNSRFPAKLVDVAPTIERLIGLPIPSGVDGVVLADALTSSTPAEQSAENAAEAARLPDVKALESWSAKEARGDKQRRMAVRARG